MIGRIKQYALTAVGIIFIVLFVIYCFIGEAWEWIFMRLGWYDFVSKHPLLNFILTTKWDSKIIERWRLEKADWIDFANFRKGK